MSEATCPRFSDSSILAGPFWSIFAMASCCNASGQGINVLTTQTPGAAAGGAVNNFHCEAALEQLTVSNIPIVAHNNYGRLGGNRAPLFGVHLDQYVPSADLSEIWAGGTAGSANIQDDACDPVNAATTLNIANFAIPATAHYIRDANSSGYATCQQFVMNTDPGALFGYVLPTTELFTSATVGTTVTTSVAFTGGASNTKAFGISITQPVVTTQVSYNVWTADSSGDNYDLGLINGTGIVVCHTGMKSGSTLFGATGPHSAVNWAIPCTLYPGRYYIAMSASACSPCAAIQGGASPAQTFFNGTVTVSTAGLLNNISPPADNALQTTAYVPSLWVH